MATALVAAARVRGVDPLAIYAGTTASRRVRMLAAAACVARLGVTRTAIAPMFRIASQELAPSMLAKAEITPDQLLDVAEALQVAGLADLPKGQTPSPQPAAAQVSPVRKPVAVQDAPRSAPTAPRPGPARQSYEAARPPAGRRASAVSRLKPVSPRIATWASHFLEAGWDDGEVAELFDVCPVELLNTLDPVEVRV
ncbi:MAG: hypothetical protein DCF29_03805 [Alphaproteobacteria bacterium]|nr:MAG: hypothetical protein DCF29_03805 [Alphaproteobacteria bacterium]